MIKDLVESIVKSLVDSPDQVNISVVHDGARVAIEIKIAAEDFRYVIGKEGVVIKALRSLLILVSGENKDIRIDVIK
jgi:uncharacterized protein